ncbi:Dihydroorotase [Morganella morganii]|nr:Dihydroorotase [Morganella morganii]
MTHPVTSLKIRRPDDWHIHFRDGAMLGTVVPFTSEFFGARHCDAEPGSAGHHNRCRHCVP